MLRQFLCVAATVENHPGHVPAVIIGGFFAAYGFALAAAVIMRSRDLIPGAILGAELLLLGAVFLRFIL
ncbi:MAG: hypothetical protein B7Z73_02460 [Planctomycetia bacterium 21-64-5]|nr:MAG: hypothetical protein B7Z73_02460 [Planctomycetia bacterium 21-64-5]